MTNCFASCVEFSGRTIKFGDNCIEGARHIRARVAIWHRIHIQAIDAARMAFHRVAKGNHGVTQGIRPKFFKNCHIARLLTVQVV
jgi:hypothetical protein